MICQYVISLSKMTRQLVLAFASCHRKSDSHKFHLWIRHISRAIVYTLSPIMALRVDSTRIFLRFILFSSRKYTHLYGLIALYEIQIKWKQSTNNSRKLHYINESMTKDRHNNNNNENILQTYAQRESTCLFQTEKSGTIVSIYQPHSHNTIILQCTVIAVCYYSWHNFCFLEPFLWHLLLLRIYIFVCRANDYFDSGPKCRCSGENTAIAAHDQLSKTSKLQTNQKPHTFIPKPS